jgi:hypothetical protein
MKFKLSTFLLTSFISCLAVNADSAKAVLYYNIYESFGNVVVEAIGSFGALPTQSGVTNCGATGACWADVETICT